MSQLPLRHKKLHYLPLQSTIRWYSKKAILHLNMLSLVVEFTLKIEMAISKNRNDLFALLMVLMESLHVTLQHTYDINLILEP